MHDSVCRVRSFPPPAMEEMQRRTARQTARGASEEAGRGERRLAVMTGKPSRSSCPPIGATWHHATKHQSKAEAAAENGQTARAQRRARLLSADLAKAARETSLVRAEAVVAGDSAPIVLAPTGVISLREA